MPRALLTVVALLLAAGGVRADAIDDLVQAEIKRQKIPGAAVAVVHQGKVVKAAGYGFANLEHQVPVKRETVFQSGSVGKMFTAAAVMLLVEDGKLTLDDPVGRHLPGAPAAWTGVTVRHLLTHTGGIREYTSVLDLRKDHTEDQLLAKAFAFKTAFDPGAKWQYSNTGYAVLGVLVSKVSGRFYGDLLAERVFRPLDMKTARIISEADVIPNRAAGYRLAKGEWKNQEWVAPKVNTTGDGSLYLTLDDYIRWDAALGTDGVLKKASWEQIWTPAKLADGKDTGYGFGWQLGSVNGHRRTHHGGAWQGFTTYFDRYPDDRLTVVVLTNLAAPASNPGKIASAVAAVPVPELAAKK